MRAVVGRRLAVGVDASAAGMAEASRRAGRKPGHGGLENALFVVAAAEAPPAELEGVADLVTVQFPWGSLLRGLLGADPRVMGGLAGLLAPGRSWGKRLGAGRQRPAWLVQGRAVTALEGAPGGG